MMPAPSVGLVVSQSFTFEKQKATRGRGKPGAKQRSEFVALFGGLRQNGYFSVNSTEDVDVPYLVPSVLQRSGAASSRTHEKHVLQFS